MEYNFKVLEDHSHRHIAEVEHEHLVWQIAATLQHTFRRLRRWFTKMSVCTFVITVMTVYLYGKSLDATFSVFRKQTPMSMRALHQRMLERTNLLQNTCLKYKEELLHSYSEWLSEEKNWSILNTSLLVNPDVLVNREQKLAWCKVPKVASTSLVHGLLRVSGGRHMVEKGVGRSQLHMILRKLMPHPRPKEDISYCTAFMVVRHPFQRILSAYRDKLMDRRERTQFKKFRRNYGFAIIKKHRKSSQPRQYRDVPSFWEFVEYLISTPVWEYNEHWRPYYFTCTPCHHHYSIILHLETLEEDSRYLVNFTGHQELAPARVHITRKISGIKEIKSNSSSKGSDKEDYEDDDNNSKEKQSNAVNKINPKLMKVDQSLLDDPHPAERQTHQEQQQIEINFYSEISLQQLLKLYEVYKIDFEMFGYDIKPYDSYVSS